MNVEKRRTRLSSGLRTALALLLLAALLTPTVLAPVSAAGPGRAVRAASDGIEDFATYTDEELLALAEKAAKNSRDYSTVSTGKAALEFPYPAERFDSALRQQVKFTKNGAIFIMPKPKSGFGVLGTIKAGTKVSVIAEYKGFYFFVTDDGRMGWNGKAYFEDVGPGRGADERMAIEDEYDLYLKDTLRAIAKEAEKNCRDYSTVSTQKVSLEFPYPDDYLGEWEIMEIKFTKNGAILILPKPGTGNGSLGAITAGTEVIVIAEYKGYYFFVADDGRMGWSHKSNFNS